MSDDLVTTKSELSTVIQEMGDDPATMTFFWQAADRSLLAPPSTIIRCTFEELPETPYYKGYGGVNGEPTIAFSERYVYFKEVYDGLENFVAVPRHPEHVGRVIPVIGD